KGLDEMSRHDAALREANPQFKGVDAELFNEVNDLRQLCDRRATEINHLAYQMKDFAVHLAANGQNTDPNVVAILKAKVNDLLPRQALAMHGTADVLEGKGAAAHFAESLKPLAARIDAFAAKPDAGIGDAEVEQIQSEIARMKAAVATVRREGIPSGNGRMRVAEDILSAVDSMLAKAEAAFSRSKNLVGDAMRRNTLETMRGLMAFDGSRQKEVEKNCPHAKALFDARDAFLKDLQAYVDSAAEDPSSQKTKNLFNAALGSAFDMRDAAKKVTVKVAREMGADFYRFQTRARGAHTVMAHLKALMRRVDETPTERLLTGASARSLFAGQVSVPDVVEARARGLREMDVDPSTAPDRLESSKRLGAGGAGEVFELQFAGGKTFVFKGETESRGGLSTQSVGAGAAYAPEQQVVQLNLASRAVADKLGFGGHIVKYSVGSHEGTFGMFMEKAKGMGVNDYRADSSKAPPGGLSADKISGSPPKTASACAAKSGASSTSSSGSTPSPGSSTGTTPTTSSSWTPAPSRSPCRASTTTPPSPPSWRGRANTSSTKSAPAPS
ncbi:MAG: hypothetical protein J6Y19_08805, partial [Kiritimatiellae bacterium]|nr:hypothetical protein [Kiritimatiellia bacterium]